MLADLKRLLDVASGITDDSQEYDKSPNYAEENNVLTNDDKSESESLPVITESFDPDSDDSTEEDRTEPRENINFNAKVTEPEVFTIDIAKPNIIIVMGFIEQSVIDLFNEQKIRYKDFLSMYSHYYMEEFKNSPNEFIKREDIEKRASAKVVNQLKTKKGVYVLRLYERTFDIKTLMNSLPKDIIEVSFIQYSIPYLFEVYKQRVNAGSVSDIHKWLEIPLKTDFEKASGKNTLEVKDSDIINGCQDCKKFFESVKDLTTFAKKIAGIYKLAYPVSHVYSVV